MIGAGSAGSVVASRLSEEQHNSVLLLEAGLDEPAWLQVPSLLVNPLHSSMDWRWEYENEGGECPDGKNIKCIWPRGKVGLSTYHNFKNLKF